ncbi:MAG: tRNA (adenosine(37)-N6)-threonylcarbamoyltransferase complex dimerization subunit type 1 TsaB [Deltaproteobacteria bacterium]|nr:tRNA (adenosine(37)-N6)-threonylcarbamoyltransferase complex dimerization subunit type 1 TsaB [Deltaproteobacteria bacterium]
MKLLALDTSTRYGSLALFEDGKLLSLWVEACQQSHNEKILPELDRMLKSLHWTISDIDYFAAAQGPGSFTGLRIGISTVKALAIPHRKKVVGVSTLEAFGLAGEWFSGSVCALLDARKEAYFVSIFDYEQGQKQKCVLQDELLSKDMLKEKLNTVRKPILCVGLEDVVVLRSFLDQKNIFWISPGSFFPTAFYVGRLALREIQANRVLEPKALLPKYGQDPHTKVKKITK